MHVNEISIKSQSAAAVTLTIFGLVEAKKKKKKK